jgi:hypothetical protein
MTRPEYNSRAMKQARIAFRGMPCWLCHRPSNQVDHVPPLATMPEGWHGELRPICQPCNTSTGATLGNQLRRPPTRSTLWR